MFQNDASKELAERYKMDPQVWKASQRTTFPYNLSLTSVVALSACTPVVVFMMPSSQTAINWSTVQILIITLAISVFAYFLS